MPSVLIVDDLLSIHEMLEAVIEPTGFATAFTTDGEKALARYKQEKFDLVLADIDMKPMDGISLLKELKLFDPGVVVIIMTAYASLDSAVQALKLGAFDYLQKPFKVKDLMDTLRRGLEYRDGLMRQESQALPTEVSDDLESRIIGKSPRIKKLIQQLKKLIPAKSPVLIMGGKGTGKTSIANLMHVHGLGANAPFVPVDCGLSSEVHFREGLLGSSGAGGTWVDKAQGGILYMQHIECLPAELQPELASVLRNNNGQFRLVVSASADLEALVEAGRFDDELFFRIASMPLEVPSLSEHIEDLPLLIRHFAVQTTNPFFDPRQIEFTEDATSTLKAYRWPGNHAELRQVVSKILSTTDTRVVTLNQLPMRLRTPEDWPKLEKFLAGQKRHYLDMVLHACEGDKVRAAAILGVDVAEMG